MSENMLHVMVDCESFGLKPNAVICTIGAVQFNPYRLHALGSTFYTSISLQSSINAGRTMDPETVLWWLQQSNAARAALVEKLKGGFELELTLYDFTLFLQKIGHKSEVTLWSCGSRDFEWLESSYAAVKMAVPWHYRVRDYRTIRDEFGTGADIPPSVNSVNHDALSDAIWQAKYLQNVFARLERYRAAQGG